MTMTVQWGQVMYVILLKMTEGATLYPLVPVMNHYQALLRCFCDFDSVYNYSDLGLFI